VWRIKFSTVDAFIFENSEWIQNGNWIFKNSVAQYRLLRTSCLKLITLFIAVFPRHRSRRKVNTNNQKTSPYRSYYIYFIASVLYQSVFDQGQPYAGTGTLPMWWRPQKDRKKYLYYFRF
jgi:hypothetical protein